MGIDRKLEYIGNSPVENAGRDIGWLDAMRDICLTPCQYYVTNCINWSAAKVNTTNKR
jgi:hypothetical protein